MSEEKAPEAELTSSAGSPVNPAFDIYNIEDGEAVRGSSPSFGSIPKTGQVVPLKTEGKDSDNQHDTIAATTSDTSSSTSRLQTGSGDPTTSSKQTSSPRSTSSELNPFAKPFRKVDESGDLLGAPLIPSNEDDESDLQQLGKSEAKLDERSGHFEEQQDTESEVVAHLRFPSLPRVNCPEKIIICLDLSSEVNKVPFVSRDYTKYQPLDLIKRALNIFVRTKSTMNPNHEFALVILLESAVWMQDFTSDVDDFINVLLDTTNDTQDTDVFDLTTLFDTMLEKVDLPFVEDMLVLPPPYIVRTMFIYGRSECIPRFHASRESQRQLSSSPYFFFDVFYVHEPPSDENLCKEVYDVFLDLDANNTSYIHEVGRNTTHLHNKMAMLLSHPLQRPVQMHASHSLNPAEV